MVARVLREDVHRPLNEDVEFDDFEAPPENELPSCWDRWKWRVAHISGAGASLSLRLLNWGRVANIVGNVGMGFFAHGAITSGHLSSSFLNRIRQVTTTVVGQATLFALTQVYFNTEDRSVRGAITQTIMVLLGANIESVLHWLFLKGANREESDDVASPIGERFNRSPIVSERLSWMLKGTAAVGLFTGAELTPDPVLQGLASFGALFYVSQVAGEIAIHAIHQAIRREATGQELLPSRPLLSRLRIVKVVLTTAPLFVPLFFIPWEHNPDTDARMRQLWWVGASIGFLDGIADKSKRERFDKTPIEALEELQEVGEHNGWDYGVPLTASAAFAGFLIWQEGWDLNDTDSKVSLAANGGTFFATLGLARLVDRVWIPENRTYWRDKAIYFVTVSPRVLGMNPLYFYLAGTNSLAMTSRAIQSEKNELHNALIIASWAAYGFSMAMELHATSSRRIRGLLLRVPLMAMANGLTMTHLYQTGVVD